MLAGEEISPKKDEAKDDEKADEDEDEAEEDNEEDKCEEKEKEEEEEIKFDGDFFVKEREGIALSDTHLTPICHLRNATESAIGPHSPTWAS